MAGDDDGVGCEVDGQRLVETHRWAGSTAGRRGAWRDFVGVRIRFRAQGFAAADVELHRTCVGGAGLVAAASTRQVAERHAAF